MATPRNSNESKNFVRGGQAAIHYLRMGKQVVYWAIGIGLVFGAAFILLVGWLTTSWYDWYLYVWRMYANTLLSFFVADDKAFRYEDMSGEPVMTTVGGFYYDPIFTAHSETMTGWLVAWSLVALIPAALAGVATVYVFNRIGAGLASSDRVRGSVLVEPDELRAIIDAKWRDWRKSRNKKPGDEYRYSIAGIDFPPDAPMVHTQMIGTTGVGKSVAMMELLDQIRARGDKAVIYDRMGAFIRYYYDPETDHILNPFDARDAGWSPFADADTGPGFAAMAEAMIPPPKNVSDPFWSTAARSVFRSLAETLSQSGRTSVEELARIILKSDLATLSEAVKNTPGGAMVDMASEKTAQSVRTSVVEPLEFLQYLTHREKAFSIGDWVREDGPGFLFLSGQVDHAAATRNLISAAIEIAANATMTCGPSDSPRIWFFIDELPSLNYLPCLDRSLAEIRQFGGCFVIGYQVFAKLRDVYGDRVAEAISGTVNNSVIFDTPDYATAKRCSENLGMEDITEKAEGMSIGANETRDGVTFQHKRIERPIATPSEIMDLPQLAAYLRYAYDTPRAKIELKWVKREQKEPPFKAPTKEAVEAEEKRRKAEDAEFEAVSEAGTPHDGDGVVVESGKASGASPTPKPRNGASQNRKPRNGAAPRETIDASALLPAIRPNPFDPGKPRRGEDRFVAEAEAWLEALRGPPSFATGEPEISFTDLEAAFQTDHFIIARLRGVAASEIERIEREDPPDDPIVREAWHRRNHEDVELLACFRRREERRAVERARTEEERRRARERRAKREAEAEDADEQPQPEERMEEMGMSDETDRSEDIKPVEEDVSKADRLTPDKNDEEDVATNGPRIKRAPRPDAIRSAPTDHSARI